MTIIVYDGKTLATDKMAIDQDIKQSTNKAWYAQHPQLGKVIISGAGELNKIQDMMSWYLKGAEPDKFPKSQMSTPFCQFIVITKRNGYASNLLRWEQHPAPIKMGESIYAIGQGSHFAYGAMAMGASAEQAVQVANRFSIFCGLGVDTYTLVEEKQNAEEK